VPTNVRSPLENSFKPGIYTWMVGWIVVGTSQAPLPTLRPSWWHSRCVHVHMADIIGNLP
jgi:hypothetical protein